MNELIFQPRNEIVHKRDGAASPQFRCSHRKWNLRMAHRQLRVCMDENEYHFRAACLPYIKGGGQMRWDSYERKFRDLAGKSGAAQEKIESWLLYAKELTSNNLPIIFDQTHLALLLGIDNEYLHRMSNAPEYFYRTFYIRKRNGKQRRIDEPLPDLKKVQSWILTEILYKVPCSKFAKAYVPHTSIKDNSRFHRNQKIVAGVDLKNFFPSIKSGSVLSVFLSMGYNLPTAVFLTRLCCLRESLPQGAPTSAYLSNLIMRHFDEQISAYCMERKIRYTRYADDLTFSGDFDVAALLYRIDGELKYLHLRRNPQKLKVMRGGDRQKTTGIVVNEKQQLPREYRMTIRQEIHYIQKFGLDDHLAHIGETRTHYLQHLMGKIEYALFINPKDEKMKAYREVLRAYRPRE